LGVLKLIETGNLIVLPVHEKPNDPPAAYAIGEVIGPYEYRTDLGPDIHHIRRVRWLRKDIPRGSFEPDLLATLGIPLTVHRVIAITPKRESGPY